MITDNHIIQGDCTQLLKTFPDRSIALVLTDPPYFVRYQDHSGRTIANTGATGLDNFCCTIAPIVFATARASCDPLAVAVVFPRH